MKLKVFVFSVLIGVFFSGCFSNQSFGIAMQWFAYELPRLISLLFPLCATVYYFIKVDNTKWYNGLLIFILSHIGFMGLYLMFIMSYGVDAKTVLESIYYFIK